MGQKLASTFDGVELTKLKKISHPKGDIYHGLKVSEGSFESFGEAYFTSIHRGDVKGWKKHLTMTLNLIVPVGEVSFYIYDDELEQVREYRIGEENYYRLTVRPGYWVAFQGRGINLNLVLNIGSIEHNTQETINAPLETFPLSQETQN